MQRGSLRFNDLITLSLSLALPAFSAAPRPRFKSIPSVTTKQLPLLSVRVRGGWKGQKIFQVIRNKQFVRRFSDYDKSAKAHLTPFQAAFRDGVALWKNLDITEKKLLDARAIYLKKHCSGFNLFLSTYLKSRFRA
jgi:hypothetical protein